MSPDRPGAYDGADCAPSPDGKRMTVITWHIHGSYLNYLARCGHDLVVPVLDGRPTRFGGRPADAMWPQNVREVPAAELRQIDADAILYQHELNWIEDRVKWLSRAQLDNTPQAFLEHDPPRAHPTDTCHVVDDPEVPIVHVTHFNQLMWDCGRSPSLVIEHGVEVPEDAVWTGDLEAGIAVVNNIGTRGRRLGPDLLERMRKSVPIDLLGMGSEGVGGRGEIPHPQVPYEVARYRFFFNPIRYTSLGLAVCEALMVGCPVLGIATTEMPVAVVDGVSGFVHTDIDILAARARELLDDHELAQRLSEGARALAREHYGIERFARDWNSFLTGLVQGTATAA